MALSGTKHPEVQIKLIIIGDKKCPLVNLSKNQSSSRRMKKESLAKNLNRAFVLAASFFSVRLIEAFNPEYYSYYYSLLCFGFFVILLCVRNIDLALIGYAIIQLMAMVGYLLKISPFDVAGHNLLYNYLSVTMLAYELFLLLLIGGHCVLLAVSWIRDISNVNNYNLHSNKKARP